MSDKSKIISFYKKKINLLKKHNKLYFNQDKPEISDSQYDDLKREIITLEHWIHECRYPFEKGFSE